MMIDHRDVVGVTELANSSSRLVAEAAQGRNVIISKNNRPTAALVGIECLQQLEDREENLGLLVLALTRMATDSGNRTELNDFIEELGLTHEVAALDDEDEDEDEDD
jgi:prevent-host-death family protein